MSGIIWREGIKIFSWPHMATLMFAHMLNTVIKMLREFILPTKIQNLLTVKEKYFVKFKKMLMPSHGNPYLFVHM